MNLFGDEQKDFFLVTIPKSGTHLTVKLLNMMTNRSPNSLNSERQNMTHEKFEICISNCKKSNQFAYNHTAPNAFNPYFLEFTEMHPEYVRLLQIRDLRDLIVSYVYHNNSTVIIEEMGGDYSFDEKLTHILRLDNSPWAKSIELNIQMAIEWLNIPDVVILRFENLIGPKGGGKANIQKETIQKLAYCLGIQLSEETSNNIKDNLFGNTMGPNLSATFREGQIGSWQKHFTEEHLELFKQNWGHYQHQLGYPVDTPIAFKLRKKIKVVKSH